MKKVNALLLAFVALVIISCKDDEPAPTTEAMLQGAKSGWIVTAATVSPAILGITDWYAQFDACDKDDATVFKSSTNYQIDNSVKCDSTEPAIAETGTWTLSTDKKVIQFKPTGDTAYEYNIVEISSTQLKFTQVETSNGVKYTFTITAKPK
jgi:hypothetical protein